MLEPKLKSDVLLGHHHAQVPPTSPAPTNVIRRPLPALCTASGRSLPLTTSLPRPPLRALWPPFVTQDSLLYIKSSRDGSTMFSSGSVSRFHSVLPVHVLACLRCPVALLLASGLICPRHPRRRHHVQESHQLALDTCPSWGT